MFRWANLINNVQYILNITKRKNTKPLNVKPLETASLATFRSLKKAEASCIIFFPPFAWQTLQFELNRSVKPGLETGPEMTRCIFRKPKRRFRLNHWLAVITVISGATLCLELQAGLKPNHQTVEHSPLLGQLHAR